MLKKQWLLVAFYVFLGHHVAAEVQIRKTFLMPRSQGVNSALENTAGWYDLKHRYIDQAFGGHIQAVGFYQQSFKGKELGTYFSPTCAPKITFGRVDITTTTNVVSNQNVDVDYLLHRPGNTQAGLVAELSLHGEHESSGFFFNYYHNLDKMLKGLSYNFTMPLVRVKNTLRPTFSDQDGAEVLIRQYLAGEYSVSSSSSPINAQEALCFGKIDCMDDVAIGIADIDMNLGYAFLDQRNARISCNIGFTIPTGNHARGERLFEAMIGNGQHFGLGLGVDSWIRCWGNALHYINLVNTLQYRYLFAHEQTRVLSLRERPFGQYYLLGSVNESENNRGIPAANITTQKVEVLPGSQLDIISALHYFNYGFSADLGYNFYFREREAITLRQCFDNDTYAVLERNYDFNDGVFTGADNQRDHMEGFLTQADLDVSGAETPRQLIHKVYGGVSYSIERKKVEGLLGIGMSVDLSWTNASINLWGAHVKAGCKF